MATKEVIYRKRQGNRLPYIIHVKIIIYGCPIEQDLRIPLDLFQLIECELRFVILTVFKVEPYPIPGSFLKFKYLKTELNVDYGTYAIV